jgi:hypothetical protein
MIDRSSQTTTIIGCVYSLERSFYRVTVPLSHPEVEEIKFVKDYSLRHEMERSSKTKL